MFLCWLKSSRALSFTRLLLSVDERKKRARSVIGKEWKTEGREKWRACKHLFKCPTRPLAENPFLSKCQMSKRQKVRRCSMVSHGSICLLQYARAKPSDWRKCWSKLSKHTLYQERLPFLWKPGWLRGEFKRNISFRWKFSGKKVIPFEVLPFPIFTFLFSETLSSPVPFVRNFWPKFPYKWKAHQELVYRMRHWKQCLHPRIHHSVSLQSSRGFRATFFDSLSSLLDPIANVCK